ncbi:MAG: hypothetical protein JWM62_1291 [Frankiales bacterium]|nr:hypothetical protein [Frankiales bacterium]
MSTTSTTASPSGGRDHRHAGLAGALLATALASYVLLLVLALVTANVVRGLVGAEVDLLTVPGESTPMWVGVLAYLQNALGLAAVGLLSAGALLAGAVESTRAARAGDRLRPWSPFLSGLRRAPAVAAGLAVVLPLGALALVASLALLVLLVVTLPALVVIAVLWWRRPQARDSWLRWPLVVAAPFGLLVAAAVRWALWLPFVVIDDVGVRAGLRESARASRGRWVATARPLLAVVAGAALLAGLVAAVGAAGAPLPVVGVAAVGVLVALLLALAVVTTRLHEGYAPAVRISAQRVASRRRMRLRPSPVMVLALLLALVGQGGWSAPAEAEVTTPAVVTVNSLVDTWDTTGQCVTDAATCTVRAAIATAPAGGVVRFAVSGTVPLVWSLHAPRSVTIDASDQQVVVESPAQGSALVVGSGYVGAPEGADPATAGESSPPTTVLRGLTFRGRKANASGLTVGSGVVTIDSSTFVDHHLVDAYGSAVAVGGGSVTVVNSTFSGNSTKISGTTTGAAVAAYNGLPLTVNASTFVGNIGGAVWGSGASVTNSVFRGEQGALNCDRVLLADGNVSNDGTCASQDEPARLNRTDSQLLLGPLARNGGPVATVALLAGSAAIGAGDGATCPATDARGQSRVGACDAGAYQTTAGTTTTLSVPAEPARFGTAAPVTVRVSSAQGAPTGTVELSGTAAGTLTETLVNGEASFSLAPPVGSYALTAAYVPTGGLTASTGTAQLKVLRQVSGITLSVDPSGESTPGAAVTLTAQVRDGSNATLAPPAGTVTFDSDLDAVTRAGTLANGVATWTGTLPLGRNVLKATYLQSDGYESSTSDPVEHDVRTASTVGLTAPASAVHGAPFDVTATLPTGATGRVTFTAISDSAVVSLPSVVVSGSTATATWTAALAPGAWQLQASYGGDGTHAAATSSLRALDVIAAATTVAITGPGAATVAGQSAAFAVTVDATASPAVPTGSVTLSVDGTVVATEALAGGQATLSTTSIPVGTGSVIATYVPSTGFSASQSPALQHTVTRGTTTTTLAVPAASVAGQSVALVATVTAAAPSTAAPAGEVVFTAGSTPLGTAPLVGGVARVSTTGLPIGSGQVIATFTQTTQLAGSTSPAQTHVVAKAPTTVALTATSAAPGQPLTLTATVAVTAPGSGTPTGDVVFKDGSTVLGTVPLAGGAAVLKLGGLAGGAHALTAAYAGDVHLLPSGGALSLTLARVAAYVSIRSVSPEPSRYGQPVTVVVPVVGQTGLTVTGQVEVAWAGTVVGSAPVIGGVATVVTEGLDVGRTNVSAHYLGDANHDEGRSPTGSDAVLTWHRVDKAAPPILLSSEASPTRFGERVRVYADVAPVLGRVPIRPVYFRMVRAGTVRSGQFDASGRAFADFFPDKAGPLAFSVSVEADPWFEALYADGFTHQVDAATADVSLVAAPATVDQPALLIATVGPEAARGIGWVHFYDGPVEVAQAPVGFDGRALAQVTFTTAGPHTLTALYDGAFGPFEQARSAAVVLEVTGRSVQFGPLDGASDYGERAFLIARMFASGAGQRVPTGTVQVRLGTRVLGSAGFTEPSVLSSGVLVRSDVPLDPSLEPGTYAFTVVYSGDATFAGFSQAATWTVERRRAVAQLDAPAPANPVAASPVLLTGRVLPGPAGAPAPTGTLTLGRGGASCTVPLTGGALGGSCSAVFPGIPETEQVFARYSGDTRYAPADSEVRMLPVQRATPRITVSTTSAVGGVWTDAEPVTVRWAATSTTASPLPGVFEVWTSEGRQLGCLSASSGTCELRFSTAATSAWVEVRYPGDTAHRAATGRVAAAVRACYDVRVVSPGRQLTSPTCGASRYLAGTQLDLDAPAQQGRTFAGWSLDRTPGTFLQPSPLYANRDLVLEPRYRPVCFTLTVVSYPATLRAVTPYPAPNCEEPVDPYFQTRDVDAIARAEVAEGRMRYRVGTRVELPTYAERLTPSLTGDVRWSGDGVGADGTLTVTQDVELDKRLEVPCSRLVVDGPPGTTTSTSGGTFDAGGNPLLSGIVGGQCVHADGVVGWVPGTQLRVALTPAAGTWFDRWGPLEPLAGHRAPTAMGAADARPADVSVVGRTASLTVTVPDFDAALSGFTLGVTCHRLDVTVQDAVPASRLQAPGQPATVATTPANCPAWWLQQKAVPSAELGRWYLAGTEVTLTASNDTRMATVDEYVTPRQISFRGWRGGVTGDQLVQRVRMDRPVAVTAEWYVYARCMPVIVRTKPAGSGEVVMSDLGTDCPAYKSPYANVEPVPQALLGTTLALAARPSGALQTIWTVEGSNVTNAQACLVREDLLQETYDDGYANGLSKAEVDRKLMVQGYLPGLTISRIQEEASRMHALGYSQADIVADLKTMGLLLPSGAPAQDRLRDDPCGSTERDTVLPAGERALSMTVDGSTIATAHFCQAVRPSVTVIGIDGASTTATGALLDRFGGLFRSSNAAGNCPTPGWFYPGTTAVLGSAGTGVPGYVVKSWTLDGVAQPAGPLSVPISTDGTARAVGATVQVTCHKLTVVAEFGSTAYPLPNCPGADASRGLYAQGTQVTVTAGLSGGHVLLGWHETGTAYNPTLVTMDVPRTLTANFRSKTVGETIMESVLDPALDAAGIAAKKAVGGIAYVVQVFGQQLVGEGILGTLSLIGTGLSAGFGALGVQGAVLDGIVVGLAAPLNAFNAGFDGFDCIQEWAWGSAIPTFGDLKETVTAAAKTEVREVQGVAVDTVLAEAQLLAAKMAAGDPAALGQAYITAAGGGPALMVLHLALDIHENPQAWTDRATTAYDGVTAYAEQLLKDEFGLGFTWEASATEAWTTGGDAFFSCMADNGKAIVGQ